MRIPPIVSFLALRTALLVTVGAVLAVVGLRGFPLIALALVISSVISLPLLTRRRDAVSQRSSG